jgi:hypothetical protein
MKPNPGDWKMELLELAQTTERVAGTVGERAITDRLRAIADEVRSMAQRSRDPSDRFCVSA